MSFILQMLPALSIVPSLSGIILRNEQCNIQQLKLKDVHITSFKNVSLFSRDTKIETICQIRIFGTLILSKIGRGLLTVSLVKLCENKFVLSVIVKDKYTRRFIRPPASFTTQASKAFQSRPNPLKLYLETPTVLAVPAVVFIIRRFFCRSFIQSISDSYLPRELL